MQKFLKSFFSILLILGFSLPQAPGQRAFAENPVSAIVSQKNTLRYRRATHFRKLLRARGPLKRFFESLLQKRFDNYNGRTAVLFKFLKARTLDIVDPLQQNLAIKYTSRRQTEPYATLYIA